MQKLSLIIAFTILAVLVEAQQLLLMDRMNGNKIVNDSTIILSSTDPNIIDLTAYFTMKNNTDEVLVLNLRKTVHYMADSTIDYFCFGAMCWPETDTTNYPDTIQPGAEDYTFASHVVHFRRFEMPPLPFGTSSITYTIFDDTSFPEPIEASVTVIYEHEIESGIVPQETLYAYVYPNPARDQINIVGKNQYSGTISVSLFDQSGRLVQNNREWMHAGLVQLKLDDLPRGSYTGKLESTAVAPPLVFRFVK